VKCALTFVLIAHLGANAEGVKAFAEGAAHLQEGRWLEAEGALARAAAELGDHPDAHALLGIARYHLGRYDRARVSLELALEKGTRYEARTLYYLGMTLSKAGADGRAAAAFARLLEQHPHSPEAGRVDPDRELARTPSTAAPVTVVLMQSVSYDDNAVRSAELPLSGPAQSDTVSFTLASLGGSLGHQLAWRALLFTKDYAALDEQDLASASAGLSWSASGGAVELSFLHRRQWLNSEDFDARTIAAVTCTSDRMRAWRVGIDAEYASKEHDVPYRALDGYARRFGLVLERTRQANARTPSGALWLSVSDDVCDAAYLGYDLWGAGVKSRFELTDRIDLGVALSYSRRTHHDVDPIGEVREDDRWSVKVHVGFPLGSSDHVTCKCWGTSIDNSSTLADCDYSQRVWGIELSVAF
jgi:tetratricopeptide (TPR) repeat protein